MLQGKRAQPSSGIDTILITSGPADIRKAERVQQLCVVALSAECTLSEVKDFSVSRAASKQVCKKLGGSTAGAADLN